MIGLTLFASVQLLHIPDGFLTTGVAALCWAISLLILIVAVRRAQSDYDERLIPLAGVMAAFIFAAQMINFPVLGGTSGHLIGAALAFIVLGPWLGVLVMTAVIALQALMFQDGGLVVMGANILVMGIVPGLLAYGLYGLVRDRGHSLKLATAGFAAWLSVVMGALVTAILLGVSGTANLAIVAPLMVGVHMLIGLGEALITATALAFLISTRPHLTDAGHTGRSGRWALAGLGIVLLVVLVAPLASSSPDGLEWVAEQESFIDQALSSPYSLLSDYTIPGLGDTALSTILAGLTGVLLVAAIIYIAGRFLVRKPRRSP